MGAVARRTGSPERHVSSGKNPDFEDHAPVWSEWFRDGPVVMRQCRHPDCDLDDYQVP